MQVWQRISVYVYQLVTMTYVIAAEAEHGSACCSAALYTASWCFASNTVGTALPLYLVTPYKLLKNKL